jgi:hypothetical protein
MKRRHRFLKAVSTALLLAAVLLAPASASLAADGASWHTQGSPSGLEGDCSRLAGIWGSSASDVFAISSCGALIHYDGQAWSLRDPGPLAAANLENYSSYTSSLWGASAADIFVAGSGFSEQSGPYAAVYRYNGSGWTTHPVTYGDSASCNGVWGTSASDVYAVGGDDAGGYVSHWNGTDWSASFPINATDALADIQLVAVWGSSASDVFAVGGGILDDSAGIILHYNGKQWSPVDTGQVSRLNSVWGTYASDVFAVGMGGMILHYDGTVWTPQENGTGIHLNANSGSDVFAAGYDVETQAAAILHYDGTSWSSMAGAMTADLRGLWGSSGSDVFAVGDSGTILHYAVSASPEPEPAPTPVTPPATTADDGGATANTPPPYIINLQADNGRAGDDLTVTISGANLGGATAVDFGSGITISEYGVVSESEITASIAIGSEAATGKRTISVTTPRGTASIPGGFEVRDAGTRAHLWVYLAAAAGGLAGLGLLASFGLWLRRRLAR